jgi:hypothetical protein
MVDWEVNKIDALLLLSSGFASFPVAFLMYRRCRPFRTTPAVLLSQLGFGAAF